MTDNIILTTDAYKVSQYNQYPPRMISSYSYFESRTGAQYPNTLFFGLQYILKKHLEGYRVTQKNVDDAAKFFRDVFGRSLFNRQGWERIVRTHGGRLPVEIRAVPEGSLVPTGNILFSIESTDPQLPWITSYLETLLVQVWYPCTVATISHGVRQALLDNLRETGDESLVDFKLHDFGYRGVSSHESAGIGGAAHLVSFDGTDTLAGILTASDYYHANVCGHSVPASEHSTMTSWGRESEAEAYSNLLTQYPDGLVSCVSDSYDIFNACENIWGDELKDQVLSRNGVLVVRPDSGDIVETTLRVLSILSDRFGESSNEKGFRVLNDKVRVIQGDGCTPETINTVLQAMKDEKWSGDNVTFGMGGGLLQKVDRDTQKFALKCSSVTVDNVERDVYKDPVGDSGKTSKKGRLALVETDAGIKTVRASEINGYEDKLETVFRNGFILKDYSFDEIRRNARS